MKKNKVKELGIVEMKNFLSYDEKIEEKTNTFEKLMTIYDMAIQELETKMNILQKEFKVFYNYDLIDHINLKLLPQGTVNDVIDACFAGDSSRISSLLSELLLSVISYFDYQELFYHAFVCGLFSGRAGIKVKSNLEQGLGRPDIAAERQRTRQGLIIECRYAAAPADLEDRAEAALAQIDKLQYGAELSQRCRQVIKIGLAFCSKSCLAKCRLQTA